MCDEWPLLRCWQLVDKDLIYLLFTFKSLPRLNDNKTVPALNNLPGRIKSRKRSFGSLLHDTDFNSIL